MLPVNGNGYAPSSAAYKSREKPVRMFFCCGVRNRDAIRVEFQGTSNGWQLKIIWTREGWEGCVVDIEGSGSGGELVVVVVDQEVNTGWALGNPSPTVRGSMRLL